MAVEPRRITGAVLCALFCLLSASSTRADDATAGDTIRYPDAPRSDTVDTYHGVAVADPYRPLENPDAPETRTWIERENRITNDFLGKINARPHIKNRLTKLWNYEKFGIPFKKGPNYFLSHNQGLQNQSVVEVLATLDGESRPFLDPNTLSADGTVALSQDALVPSDDGRFVAYGLASAGSDWVEWRVREVATGKDLDDHLRWIKFSIVSWSSDHQGFYYGRFPEPRAGEDLKAPNYNQQVYYHKLGTPQSDDVLIYERPDHKEWTFHADVTDDGRYLVISTRRSSSAKHRIFLKKLAEKEAKVVELLGDFDSEYSFIGSDGARFWFKTDHDAPRGRVIAIDVEQAPGANFQVVIPEAKETLVGVSFIGDRLIATYLKDAHSQVNVFDRDGKLVRELPLPGIGSVQGFYGKRTDTETFFSFESYTQPSTVYHYHVLSGETRVFRAPRLDFKPEDFETRQSFLTSKDGTRIPIFLSYRKGTRLDSGETPTCLYGYGGFNIPMVPNFSPSNLCWMELGGIFAVANLRGGGEYGEDWHRAGTKLQKQNVFDDFIAAAEWLVSTHVTSTPKLVIEGRSNGGLLVGAVLNQRPDLFGAALPGVGVMDMLRFHKFTIGWAWVDDFGSSDDPDQFRAIHAYSPLHTIKKGACYPPTLITTADHDDRVVPAHSFKYAATLQSAQGCKNPILIRIETQAGHGAGKPTTKRIDEAADKWAFVVQSLRVPLPKQADGD